jgi:flagellar hook-associated protein 2
MGGGRGGNMSTFTGGLVSGIDTGAMISSLVAAAAKPLDVIKNQKATAQDRKDAYDTLGSRLDALGTALASLDTLEEFRSVTGTTSDDSALGITVGGDAVVGRFSIKVDQLAAAAMSVSDGFASRTATGEVATGTLKITVGDTATEITVGTSQSSLDGLAKAINEQVDGVTAYVMETGDATKPYRLVISGDDTGAENAVSIDTSGLDGSTGTIPTMTEVTAAQDAKLEVNGITITSSQNEVSGAIQGVTFNAREVTSSPVTVNVARDTATMTTKMKAVVTAYNSIMSYIRGQKSYNPDENIRGAFVGESQPNSVMQRMQSMMASTFTATGSLSTLSSIGITTEQDGDIALDEDVLHTALTSDFEDVVSLFTTESTGVAASLTTMIEGFTGDTGTVTGRSNSLATQLDTFDERISAFQDKLDSYRSRMEKQFTNMEIAMSRFQNAQSQLLALMPDTSTDN